MAGKFPGGCLWAVLFSLPSPAARNGYIIQEVLFSESGTGPSGGKPAAGSKHYWEAWPIAKGDTGITDPNSQETVAKFVKDLTGATLSQAPYQNNYNDIFFNSYLAGSQGRAEWRAVAAFYEVALPKQFIPNNQGTNSGKLLSTTTPPNLWQPTFWHGSGLMRVLTFQYNFQKTRTNADAVLQGGHLPNGTMKSKPTMKTLA